MVLFDSKPLCKKQKRTLLLVNTHCERNPRPLFPGVPKKRAFWGVTAGLASKLHKEVFPPFGSENPRPSGAGFFKPPLQIYFLVFVFLLLSVPGVVVDAADPEPLDTQSIEPLDTQSIEIVAHRWRPDVVWEKIGKTKFIWNATVRNHSNFRKRVFVYYDLLDSENVPLARNVANTTVGPGETVDITADSYINTQFLPQVKSSRATLKVGFPN